MKKIAGWLGILIACWGCGEKNAEQLVEMTTSCGTIVVKLYDETPRHRDHFMQMVRDSVYDGMLFHRVIADFMIQAGDPASKTAGAGELLGEESAGAMVDAEFVSGLFHKKGVLAAAREGDNVNPTRKSSGSHFYLVQGKVYTAEELPARVERINESRKQAIYNGLIDANRVEFDSLQLKVDLEGMDRLTARLTAECEALFEKERLELSPEQVAAYTTVGGTPHLDGYYTVFGEIVEGMEVLEQISAVKTDRFDRPLKDVRITQCRIRKK